MEYVLGSVITLIGVGLVALIYAKSRKDLTNTYNVIRYSQAHIHEIIKRYIPESEFELKRPKSQSQNQENSRYTRVVFVENHAYWIRDNSLFMADMDGGMVDEETTRKVDTINMDKVQLEKITHIVEALTEGRENDSGNSRNKNI